MVKKNIITITDAASEHIKKLLGKKKGAIGISVSLVKGGCSGHKYKFDYVFSREGFLEVKEKEVSVFVDKSAELMIFGTEMHYHADNISSGFVFENPNVKAQCGCGESVLI
jgi:iron-sulfur cluster assembly protein